MGIKRYRPKTEEINAVQWTGENTEEIEAFIGESLECGMELKFGPDGEAICDPHSLTVPTLKGDMEASIGDYIVRKLHVEYCVCTPDEFEKEYEEIEG